jgi:hypothetical protein
MQPDPAQQSVGPRKLPTTMCVSGLWTYISPDGCDKGFRTETLFAPHPAKDKNQPLTQRYIDNTLTTIGSFKPAK